MKDIESVFTLLSQQYDLGSLFELWWLLGNHVADQDPETVLQSLRILMANQETSNAPMLESFSKAVIDKLAANQADMIINILSHQTSNKTPISDPDAN